MTVPPQIILVPITGTWLQGDGTPYGGTVTFTPGVTLLEIPASKTNITPPIFKQSLNAAGTIGLSIWSTDNTLVNPRGWQWTVTVALTGSQGKYSFSFPLDVPGAAASGGIDLSTIDEGTAVVASSGSSSYVTTAGALQVVQDYLTANPSGGSGVSLAQVNSAVSTGTSALQGTPTPTAPFTTLRGIQDRLVADEGTITNLTTALNAKASATTWKSAATTTTYTATPGDGINADATSAPFTVTLPAGPADGVTVRVKKTDVTANVVTIVASGSDVFLNIGTAASSNLLRPGQTKLFSYVSAISTWLVQDMPSLADLLTTYLPANYAPATGSANYASNAAAFKVLLMESGDNVTSGMDLRPNGAEPRVALLVNAFGVELDMPATGSQVWRLVNFETTTGVSTVVATVTVPALTRAASVGSLAYNTTATSRLLVQNTSVSGSFNGQGVTARVALGSGATLTAPTAPATPTGLAATNGASAVSLSWGSATGATSYLILVDGIPVGITTSTSYSYPSTSGSSHTFAVAALCPGNMSAPTASVSGGSFTSYSFFSSSASQSDGAPVGWTTAVGGTGAGQAVSVTGNVLHLISGNSAGSSAVADMVGAQVNADSATHTLWDAQAQFCLDNTTSFFDWYASANAMTSTFGYTNGVQFELGPSTGRIGIKAVGYLSGAFTQPTYSTTTGATSGNATYPITVNANGTNFYGVRARIIDPGDGTLTAQLYIGTTAQLAAGTLPLFLAATLPSAFKTALAPGNFYIRQLGATGATAATEGSRFQSMTVTPMTAAGV